MTGSVERRTRLAVPLAWAGAAALLVSASVALEPLGLEFELVLAVAASVFVFGGIGRGLLVLAGYPEDALGPLAAPWAVGVCASAIVSLALASAGAGGWAFWLLVAAASASWLQRLVRAVGTRTSDATDAPDTPDAPDATAGGAAPSQRGRRLAAESLLLAALVRVAVSGSQFLAPLGEGRVRFAQYWDLLWHLAMVKDGVFRGLPIANYPLMAGFPRQAYHPAFDTLVATVFKGTGLLSDERYFGLALPLAFVSFGLALFAACAAWSRSPRAGWIASAFLALTFLGVALPAGVVTIIGRLGFSPLRHFLYNPPSLLGATAVLVTVALVAGLPRERQTGALVLAAAIAAGSVAFKANVAVAACPAFAAMVAIGVWRGRIRWRAAIAAAVVALAVGVAAFATTRGEGGGVGVQWAAYARYLRESDGLRLAGLLQRELAALLGRLGLAGDTVFTLFYVLVGLTGWRLVVAAIAAPWAWRSDRNPVRRSPDTAWYLGLFLGMVTLVALTLVQHDPWITLAWNIAGHTVQHAWWVSIVIAAVVLDAAVPSDQPWARVSSRWREPVRLGVLALVLVALVAVGSAGMRSARQVGIDDADAAAVSLLRRLASVTPADAVVAQHFDVERGAWVAGFGGRSAYLERRASRELTRGEGDSRKATLDRLYATTDAAEARKIASDAGIDYALVRNDEAPGLRAASEVVLREGDWLLVRLELSEVP